MNEQTKVDVVRQSLKCLLTDEEKQAKAGELAMATTSLEEKEDEKAEVSASFNAAIKELKARCGRVATVVTNGYEYREVECEIEHDYKDGTITTIRRDTMEVVGQRSMTTEEREQGLPFEK